MTEVAVFAEDAVAGCLPPVCVRRGISTTELLAVRAAPHVDSPRLGLAWLLLFLGPVGWAALIVIALARRPRGGLVVQVPCCGPARHRLARTRRLERASVVTVVGLMVVEIALLLADPSWVDVATTLLVVAIAVAVAATLVSALQLVPMEVRARLDPSRRWVVLANVAPEFAFAAWEQSRSHTSFPGAGVPPDSDDPALSSAAS
jgi:hypothetical protein